MAFFLYLKLQLDLWCALNRSSCQTFVSQATEKGLNQIKDKLCFGRYTNIHYYMFNCTRLYSVVGLNKSAMSSQTSQIVMH